MKVGVITYHRSNNYGAQLQAYAIIRALEKLGHEAEILDCNAIGDGEIFHWNFQSIIGFLGALRNNALSLTTEFKRKNYLTLLLNLIFQRAKNALIQSLYRRL